MWSKKELAAVRENAQVRYAAVRKGLESWQEKSRKVLRDLSDKGSARERFNVFFQEFSPAAKLQFNRWKSVVIESVGIASVGQVRHLERELSRLSRKLASVSGKSTVE
jgi:hypothetical protein